MKTKIVKTMISVILAFCFIFSMTSASALGNNTTSNKALFNIEENDEIREVRYYEKGELSQIAILFKDSNNIYLFDNFNSIKSSIKMDSEKNIISSNNYTKKYSLNNIMTASPISISNTVTRSVSYSYLQSKTMVNGGVTYRRYLYGGTDMREYLTRSWHFGAGTAVSVISVALGVLFPGLGTLAGIVGVSGGYILSSLTSQYYQRDYFWKYKVVQTTPSSFTIYTDEFDYLRKKEIRHNSYTNGWETIYTNSYVYSSSFRDDVLTYPSTYQ